MKTTFKYLPVLLILSLFVINLSFAQTKEMNKKDKMEKMSKDSIECMNKDGMMKDDKMMKSDKMMKDEGDIKVIDLIQHPGKFNKTELILTPGKYRFNITNTDVNKEVGFYLHESGKKEPSLNSGLSGTIKKGETKSTGIVELKAGSYEYSCPLNPTPEYKIIVK